MLCAIAPNPAFLIVARLAQGSGAALMGPNTLSILGMLYTGRDRVRAFSAYGMVLAVAATGGQLIGGALVNANIAGLGWRAVFWVNVPIGLAALALVRRVVPESRSGHTGRLDLSGVVLHLRLILPLVSSHLGHRWDATQYQDSRARGGGTHRAQAP